MKFSLLAATAALALLAVSPAQAASPGCTVNWVNGDCGPATSDDSADKSKAPVVEVKEPDCEDDVKA
jgi:hypothetical protein